IPLPVESTPSAIAHVTGAPSIICHALLSAAGPTSTVASCGGGAGLSAPGVTIGGCGRFPSWMCHRPFGCIGGSSSPVGACCPVTIPAHARLRIAITIARIVFTPVLDQYVGRSVIAFPIECSADLRALHRIGDPSTIELSADYADYADYAD